MDYHKDLSILGWEKVKKRQLHRFPLVKEWIELTGMQTGHSVLDIGPGPGVFTLEYTKTVGASGKVTVLEKSEEAVQYLSNQLIQRNREIAIITGDAEDAQYEDRGPFDFVMLTDILHHTNSPVKVLENLYNNLNTTKTCILISEFDPSSKGELGPPLENRISPEQIMLWLRSIGFTVVSNGKQKFEHYYIITQKKIIK